MNSPPAAVGTCSADFEHVQRATIPGTATHVEALYIDLVGNRHSDLHVIGVIYSDRAGLPSTLLARSLPVLVSKTRSRSWVRFDFATPVDLLGVAAVWLGEQAGAPPGVKPVPGGPNSLACFASPAGPIAAGKDPPLRYMPWAYVSGPKQTFGPASKVIIASQSLSVFAAVL